MKTKQIGIYEIKNTTTGRIYIGQSRDIHGRVSGHKRSLRCGNSENSAIQADWDHFGEEAFTFTTIAQVAPADLDQAERAAIAATPRELLYNVLSGGIAGSIKIDGPKSRAPLSDEARIRMAIASRTAWADPIKQARRIEAISRGVARRRKRLVLEALEKAS